MNRLKLALLSLTILVVVGLSGCAEAVLGGGGGGGSNNPPPVLGFSLTPATATVRGSETQQFTATDGKNPAPSPIWSVDGVIGGGAITGTIDANGVYTAPEFPPSPNSVTIGVVESADSTKSGTSAVTLKNPVPQITSVTPSNIPVGNFSITLTGAHFAQGAVVSLGSTNLTTVRVSSTQLTATGAAVASQAGNIGITVTNPDPEVSSPFAAQVLAPNPNIKVSVSPASVTMNVAVNAFQTFTATVTNTTVTAVTWSVNGIEGGDRTVGTIDENGVYYAPDNLTNPNPVTITATSQANLNSTGNAAVNLQNPPPVLASVGPPDIGTGIFQLSINGTGFVNTSTVTFGGQPIPVNYASPYLLTIVGNALPAQVGPVTVQVTSPGPGGGVSGTTTVQVTNVFSPVESPAAVRFLEQSTFGPNMEWLTQLQELGFDTYLTNQFAAPVTAYPTPKPHDSIYDVQRSFFVNSIAGGDQLRQRVALGLNELWVTAGDKISDPLGYTNYMRTLEQDALGNYYNVMRDVTLTPAMGHYLDMVDNDKPAPGQHANENYAREIMQLFCLGLNQLNPDGTPVLDGSGNPVPTYTQDDVMALGRSFTGWTYPVMPGAASKNHNPAYFGGPMIPVDSNHDTGAKTLLGQSIAPGLNATAELDAALTIIFNHPNVGPFVARQLILRLVSSNPSPAYIQRVAQAFDSGSFSTYGSGQRGDLQATVAAILLDPEARQGDLASTSVLSDGKLREPIVMEVSIARAFHAKTDAYGFSNAGDRMSQNVFYPQTVFNFFPPVYPIPGSPLNGPEFGIFDTSTSLARVNFISDSVYGAIGSNTKLDFTPVFNAGTPDQMLDWLNVLFLHGTMPDDMKAIIVPAISAVDPTDTHAQARTAIYLVTSSSMYQVQH